MSESLDHDDPIEEVASDWLTQREEGFSLAQKRDFERWCRADPRHAAAAARLEAACALLEKMPLVRAELQPVVEFPVKPRVIAPVKKFPVLRVVFAMAAAVVLAAFGWWQWARPQPSAQLYATSTGGYERVVLADASVVELNANSEVRVDLLPSERRVALVRGEAHFTVAHDTARPFIVSAHGVAVRAVGTAFNVRLAATSVEVLVTEGKVAVSDVGPALAAGLRPAHQRQPYLDCSRPTIAGTCAAKSDNCTTSPITTSAGAMICSAGIFSAPASVVIVICCPGRVASLMSARGMSAAMP